MFKRLTGIRAFVLLLGCLLFVLVEANGATYYTAATGEIRDPIWSTTTNGIPGALPVLASGDIIYIDDDITITAGNFTDWQNLDLTIYLNATISIEDQLALSQTTSIIFETSSARVIGIGPGNSEKIKFGNGADSGWSGNDGNLTGPGTLDQNYDPGTSPLPIQLLFFKVKQTNGGHLLEWATVSEINFSFFSVERSADGINFRELEQVKGHGNTNERKDYSFENRNPLLGKNYYRLKSVDFDGSSQYFNVVSMDFVGEKTFVVIPNPASGNTVNFSTNFVPGENAAITVFDNSGTVVGVYRPTDSFQSVTFDNRLRSGLYFARLVTKDYVKVERFVVH
jgi:hypothetical protein